MHRSSEAYHEDANDPQSVDEANPTHWPTDYNRVNAEFGEPRATGPHNGLDIRAWNDTPIYSTEDGVIIDINQSARGGDQIFIRNHDGSISGYAHTGAVDGLTVGSSVTAGQQIGISNGSGGVPAHLHYTYRPGSVLNPATLQTAPVDPMRYQLQNVPRPPRVR